MHTIQKKILNFLQKAKVTNIGISQLGRFIDEKHPQQIKHHLEQLVKKGFISWNPETGVIKVLNPVKIVNTALVVLPIFGSANCGPAEIAAKENLEGFLKVSKTSLGKSTGNGLFVVRAAGDSLNNAKDVPDGPIEDGDYVVIDSKYKAYKNGDYVLSIIDENANLKRFYKENDQVTLMSESKAEIPPIYINQKDFPDYLINGKIIKVFKKPKK